jgi:hypothetical protein
MNWTIEEEIPNGLNNQELQLIETELYRLTKLINIKLKEVCVLNLLNIFQKKYLDDDIYIVIYNEEGRYYPSIVKLASDSSYIDLDEEDIEALSSIMELNVSIYEKIFNKNGCTFKNNEEGRDKLIEFFLGQDWAIWKKNRMILKSHDNLEKTLDDTNKNMKKKLKV